MLFIDFVMNTRKTGINRNLRRIQGATKSSTGRTRLLRKGDGAFEGVRGKVWCGGFWFEGVGGKVWCGGFWYDLFLGGECIIQFICWAYSVFNFIYWASLYLIPCIASDQLMKWTAKGLCRSLLGSQKPDTTRGLSTWATMLTLLENTRPFKLALYIN